MADSVDGLVIEIESSASSVAGQLDILTNRLSALKTAVSGSTPIKTFSKNYQELVRVINTTQIDTVQLEAFRAFGQVLNSLNAVKVSGTVAKNITSLNTAVNGLNLEGLANVTQYTSTLSQLSDIKISPTLTKRLNELAEFGQKIQGQNFSSLQQFTSALAQLGTLANVDASAIKALSTQTKNFGNTARSASTRGRTFNTVLANIRVRTLALVRATQMITRVVTKSLTVYGDYIETLNLFKQAMGDAAGEAYEFGEKAQNLLGIDLTQWMKAQGVLNSLAVGFGVSSDRAAIMSQNLTQLAYDISSFYNIDVDTAIEKVRSGFSGQIRPVRDLGYDLSQAKLEAIALSMGIDKSVKSMTQGEKSQLRYIALMTQLTHVQGDLARTLDSPINQMRILQAQLNQMYREIGLTLLPILNKVLPYLNAILRVIKMIASEIAAMFGYVLPTLSGSADWSASVSMGAEDLEEDLESATGAAEKLKNTLASFDQINLISSKSSGSGSGGGTTEISGTGFDFDLPTYDFLGDAAENKAKQIAEGMMKSLRPFLDDFLKPGIKWVVENLDKVIDIVETLATVAIGKTLVGSVLEMLGVTGKALTAFKTAFSNIVIGVALSYMGGQDLAKGDWFGGILKSTVGAAATMYGFTYALGAGGLTIGLGVSLAFILAGYNKQKQKEFVDSCNDIFFALRDGRQSVEQFTEKWDGFIESFANPELDEKVSVSNKLKEDLTGIQQSVEELQISYMTGGTTAATYAVAIQSLFKEMSDKIIEYNEAASESIRTALQGELKVALLMSGVTMDEIDRLLATADENIKNSVSDIEEQMTGLVNQLNSGDLSETEFNRQMNELYDQLKTYGVDMGETQKQIEDFKKEYEKGINFESWDQLLETVYKVQNDYNNAMVTMKVRHAGVIDAMESKLVGLTGEDRDRWEEIIKITKWAMEQQETELTEGYKNTLSQIEETGYINWLEVYNTKGIEGAIVEYREGAGELNKAIQESYDSINQTREDNAFTLSSDLMKMIESEYGTISKIQSGWETAWVDFITNGVGLNKSMHDSYADLEKQVDTYFGKVAEAYKENQKASDGTRQGLSLTTKAFGDYVNKADYYAQLYNGSCKMMEKDTSQAANEIKVHFDKMGNIVAITSNDMIGDIMYGTGLIGDTLASDGWSVNPLRQTMNDVINVVDTSKGNFTNSFWGLMNSATRVLGDPTGMMQRSLFNALDVPEQKMVGLGFDLGVAITDGIESTAPEFKNAAHTCVKGMADEFNIFGEEVYKYFGDLFNAGTGVLTVMGISSGQNNVNIKKPKIKGYATGGFPDTADFFYANENGVPEYVGSMGGRTAVATNNDIVKGVSDGVYRAIKETGIQSDVRRIASKDSKVVFAPSEEAGRFVQQSVNLYNGAGGRY